MNDWIKALQSKVENKVNKWAESIFNFFDYPEFRIREENTRELCNYIDKRDHSETLPEYKEMWEKNMFEIQRREATRLAYIPHLTMMSRVSTVLMRWIMDTSQEILPKWFYEYSWHIGQCFRGFKGYDRYSKYMESPDFNAEEAYQHLYKYFEEHKHEFKEQLPINV